MILSPRQKQILIIALNGDRIWDDMSDNGLMDTDEDEAKTANELRDLVNKFILEANKLGLKTPVHWDR